MSDPSGTIALHEAGSTMPLRLITGPANVGKTVAVLEEALAAVAAGASSTLVVPNHHAVKRLEEELSARAPLGIRVATVDQFARDLWSTCWRRPPPYRAT